MVTSICADIELAVDENVIAAPMIGGEMFRFTPCQGVPPVVFVPMMTWLLMAEDEMIEVTVRKSCVVATATLLVGPVIVSLMTLPPWLVPVIVNLAPASLPLDAAIWMRRWVSRAELLSEVGAVNPDENVAIPFEDAAMSVFET